VVRKPPSPDREGSSFSRSSRSDDPAPDTPSLIDEPRPFHEVFQRAVDAYGHELLARGFSPSTLAQRRQHLGALASFLSSLPVAPSCLADVTPEHLSLFRDHEMARERRWREPGPLSARTLQIVVSTLRAFFGHLVRKGLILLDPTLDLSGPKVPRRLPREIPTTRQMRRLLSAADTSTALGKRDRAILELLYVSGLRNAELCGLRRGDVDLERHTVFVRHGKGDKERLVPLGRKAAEALVAYLAVYDELSRGRGERRATRSDEPALFLNRDGGDLGAEGLRRLLTRSLKAARLSVKATPHTLRHACATHLLRGGAGIRQIQTLLGHACLETTEIYTKVDTSDLQKMLDKHHPRSRVDEEP
jgi:integrase/recombinase XerD